MSLLITGVVLWAVIHLLIRLAPELRQSLIDKLGEWPYKGVFSLAMLVALALIIVGWQTSTAGAPWYVLPWARPLALVLMALAACLFVAANTPTDIKRVLRHPQLLSLLLWSLAHLLANGDLRSWILFGGLGLWGLAQIAVVNRAEGEWRKPAPVGAAKTAMSTAIGLAVFVAVIYLHALSGVPVI